MSEEQLKAFQEAVQADAGLQEKLKAATDADAVVAIAKAAGFVISTGGLNKAQEELSDEELAGVAGGYPGMPYQPAEDVFWCGWWLSADGKTGRLPEGLDSPCA